MTTGEHDFDFLVGSWQVRHRRLRQRLQGSGEWDDFGGTCTAWPLMDGFGNVDDNVLDLPGGAYRAVSLRSFEAASATWSIWWLDGRSADRLDTPVRGAFVDGVGTFLADDVLDGRPICVRFRWLDVGTGTPLWEQAFSPDGGRTWETNWTMRFSRTA